MRKIILFALLGLPLTAGSISADDGVDCHSLPKWEKNKEYNEGDLVWAENQDYHSQGSEYKCSPRSVHCKGPYDPKGESEWKVVGKCKGGSKPN